MKKLFVFAVLILSLSIFATGCAERRGNESLEKITAQEISEKIRKGKSTKADVTNLLGTPSRVDTMTGDETWTYYLVETSITAKYFIPFNAFFGGAPKNSTRTCTVTFTNKGIVKDLFVMEQNDSDMRPGLK
jgi:Small protein A (tmRNA-binding)